MPPASAAEPMNSRLPSFGRLPCALPWEARQSAREKSSGGAGRGIDADALGAGTAGGRSGGAGLPTTRGALRGGDGAATVDIDIRSHREWLVEDLANQSVDDLRRAFHRWMAPEKSLENASWLPDYNHDGVHDWQDLQRAKEDSEVGGDRLKPGLRAEKDRRSLHYQRGAVRSVVFAEGFNEEISGVVAG